MIFFSIIVTFKPVAADLASLCQTLKNCKSEVIIVDNTELSYLKEINGLEGSTVIPLGKNTGIAYAQNVGIKHAILNGADVVVFFDQDSKIDSEFLSNLLVPLTPGKPMVVSPVCWDEVNGIEYPSHKLNRYGLPMKIYSNSISEPFYTDIVIASGSAATTSTFKEVGVMDEDFFIDLVDIEWCFRCRSKKVPVQVIPRAIMRHSIGEAHVKLGAYRGIIHSPIRTYYKVRNCFLLFRKRHVPFLFSMTQLTSALVHNLILLAFVKNKSQYFNNYIFAVIHGILGIVGKKP